MSVEELDLNLPEPPNEPVTGVHPIDRRVALAKTRFIQQDRIAHESLIGHLRRGMQERHAREAEALEEDLFARLHRRQVALAEDLHLDLATVVKLWEKA